MAAEKRKWTEQLVETEWPEWIGGWFVLSLLVAVLCAAVMLFGWAVGIWKIGSSWGRAWVAYFAFVAIWMVSMIVLKGQATDVVEERARNKEKE